MTNKNLTSLLLGGILLVGLTACGGSGDNNIVGPGEPGPGQDQNLSLSQDTIRLTEIGQQGQLTASVGNQHTSTPTLSVQSQNRWLEERSVVEPDRLQQGDIQAHGPGEATLNVRAFGQGPKTVVVVVELDGPTGLSVQADEPVRTGEEVEVRGYRMNELDGAGSFGGGATTGTVRDSATMVMSVPELECQGAGQALVEMEGLATPEPLRVQRARPEALELQPGDTLTFTAQNRPCLKLASQSATYGLAYLDVDAIENARTGRESGPGTEFTETYFDDQVAGTFEVEIREQVARLSSSSTQSLTHLSNPDTTPPDVRMIDANRSNASNCSDQDFRYPCPGFNRRSKPWELGDTFLMTSERRQNGEFVEGEAEIVRVADQQRLVIALFKPDSAHFDENFQNQLDEALDVLLEAGYPYFRQVAFPQTGQPITCRGCGQTLLIFQDFGESSSRAFASMGKNDREITSWISMDLGQSWGTESLTHTLVHEIAHQYNHRYLWETPSTGGDLDFGNPTLWADEGLANLHAGEVVRRHIGIELTANTDRWQDGNRWVQQMSQSVRDNQGRFTAGYDNSQGFLRGLMERMVRAGIPLSEATQQVVHGALEGWMGYDQLGARRTGLRQRMRNHWRNDWKPATSMMRWALSQGGDDLYDRPTFQNFGFYEAGQGRGWQPEHRFRVGRGNPRFHDEARYGSVRYLTIKDTEGLGGTYQLQDGNTNHPVRWMLIRYH